MSALRFLYKKMWDRRSNNAPRADPPKLPALACVLNPLT